MRKYSCLFLICFVVICGCAKRPSQTGGTVMSSGEIAFFYGPGWVVNKEEGTWRFEHPDATAWGAVFVADNQLTTDELIKLVEDEISNKWGGCTVLARETIDIQGRSVCKTKYSLNYYLTTFSASGLYYGGQEGVFAIVTYIKSGQEWVIQKDMDGFMKGIAFRKYLVFGGQQMNRKIGKL